MRDRKEDTTESFSRHYGRKGYLYVRADGEMLELRPGLALSRYQNHRVEVLVDKLGLRDDEKASGGLEYPPHSTPARQGGDYVVQLRHGTDEVAHLLQQATRGYGEWQGASKSQPPYILLQLSPKAEICPNYQKA